MKKFFKYLSLFIVIVVVVFALGPRPDANDTITFSPDTIGDDLSAYLSKVEADIPNLTSGAEKEVIWFDPTTKAKTPISIVYLHGFSATKYETRPVADNVARQLGANLFYTRFKGHGRDGPGLADTSVQDWSNDYAEAIAIGERIGEKVLLMATSNGGLITTWGLSKPELANNVMGVVFASPNFELRSLPTWLANIPWAETILPAVAGDHYSWEASNPDHDKWWTTAYPSKAIFPMTSMLKLVKDIDKSKINIPALFFYSPEDLVVVPAEIEAVANQWGGSVEIEKVEETTDKSKHVIMGDILSPENTAPATVRIVEWAKSLEN